MGTSPGAEHREPRWPVWEKRTGEYAPADQREANVCPCVWLEPVYEDQALVEYTGTTFCRCVDCGRGWERDSQRHDGRIF